MTTPEQRRLRRSAALHGIAVAVFAMLAWSGAGLAGPGLYGMAVPFIVTGVAGAVGAAVLAVNVWRLQFEEAGAGDRDGADVRMDGAAAIERIQATQRAVRRAMAAAAVVVLIAGVTLAPRGIDRGFVISLAAGLAVTLASFALLAGDRRRTVGQPSSVPGPQ
jgi:hypothetical protein